MTNLVSFASLVGDIQQYKNNPAGMLTVITEATEAALDGKIDIVDATSPYMNNLEASVACTVAAINENYIATRHQYPSLAQNETELYRHMSDKDFIDRFATPSTCDFVFLISYSDLLKSLVVVDGEKRVPKKPASAKATDKTKEAK